MLLDIIIIVMLNMCLWGGYVLNQRINGLQKSKVALVKMMKEFDYAIIRAESSVSDLTKLSNDTSKNLKNLLGRAEIASRDLNLMTDIGSDMIQKLEDASQMSSKKIPSLIINTTPEIAREEVDAILDMVSAKRKKVDA